jgi:hypothetical protein
MLILGHCSCGNISFELDWSPDPSEIPARACPCTFCQAHQGIWTSSPTARLAVQIRHPALTSRHRFATQTAEFLGCTRCGDTPLVTSHIAGRLFAVVNTHALRGDLPLRPSPGHPRLDDETRAERIERRQRSWIPDVRVDYLGS